MTIKALLMLLITVFALVMALVVWRRGGLLPVAMLAIALMFALAAQGELRP